MTLSLEKSIVLPMNATADPRSRPPDRCRRDWPFFAGLAILSGVYILLILAMIVADLAFTTPQHLLRALASPEIRYSIKLSLISCTLTTLLSLWIAVPTGYLMSRFRFPGKRLMDAVLDIDRWGRTAYLPPLRRYFKRALHRHDPCQSGRGRRGPPST